MEAVKEAQLNIRQQVAGKNFIACHVSRRKGQFNMKKEQNLMESLRSMGYDVSEVTTIKNGVNCTGIRIMTDDGICPIVYYSQEETLETIADRIAVAMRNRPSWNLRELSEVDFYMQNAYLAIQKKSDENLVKREYLEHEIYVRVNIQSMSGEEVGSIKINRDSLEQLGLDEDDLFHAAVKNGNGRYQIQSMADILGFPMEEIPMYVGTSFDNNFGAAILYYPEVFRNFCLEREEMGCYILPSSTQDVIVLQESESMHIGNAFELALMVDAVNASEVAEEIQLDPVVFFYDLTMDEIRIVASVKGGC